MKKYILLFITFVIFVNLLLGQSDWIEQNSGTTYPLNDVLFVNNDTGWIVGSNGIILNTTDGGENWNLQNGNTFEILQSLYFTDYYHGWIVGLNGMVLHTSDGGSTWIQQTIEAENNFFDVFFLNSTLGWICGDDNYPNNSPSVYKTINGGDSWSIANNELSGQYENIYFSNIDTGWTIGWDVVKSTDGGNTWTQQADFSNIHSASFVNKNTIYCAYGMMGAIIYKTNDGGDSWETINISNIPQTTGFSDVFFINENIGWLSTASSLFLKTIDSGNNWQPIYSPLPNTVFKFFFLNESTGWFVGYDGSIFKYSSTQSAVSHNINDLQQNLRIYPNPFGFETSINFTLHQPCIITIKIYNSIGQEIETLFKGYQLAGEHQLKWTTEGLACEIYFLRMTTDNKIFTKKIIKNFSR